MTNSSTIMITGANRGIGLAFVEKYLQQGDQVIACCRHPGEAHQLHSLKRIHKDQLQMHTLDVDAPESIEQLANKLSTARIDILINNAGVYGPKGSVLGEISQNDWQKVFTTNAIAPLLVCQAFQQQVAQSQQKIMVCISSKMGSMADNSSGGSYIYRSSKAALNAVVKSLALDLYNHEIKIVALHPGWVQTEMGGANALISTTKSVDSMVRVIENIDENQIGRMLNYDGTVIPW
ncbi:SDR family oxidoreductase [Corallincola luteus]|uniref:SDR family NAD(P)-dependent oxidoreductase n=2 Tax=Corallincola TaxID=1775176 RepID=A0A368NHG9_9GAMM|nr:MULTISPECIES: SDR family oxidoreductase [Corallincola]RCU48849.1 SDR family NAD(P)-dependent oxidoreductase [Corallincola holothuriorum]TCI02990.1 SDR family oxidoreductase [Corallincola luteus]